ncbi:MAG: tRNA (adenosine(37)-N6)-dimethylallyltransferase MiaA [Woeseiaceae bacterium]|nr:tRNA (adenosine(37)-N6)-dimethylallyltransferase MiaA [Woeseiaceae bacterium]
MAQNNVVCLMGPTASGKTDLALELAGKLPVDLVSVDSALVYRGMDIGTAKPDPETLRRTPHRLIDIREPEDSYSAGDFVRDARREIEAIHRQGRVPLLVGGTMMYFRVLTDGMADLPEADPAIRSAIDAEAKLRGWPALHAQLAKVDADAAVRIEPNDSQRIQRALEVFRLSGKPISHWQAAAGEADGNRYLRIALVPASRPLLHERIARRLEGMLARGFVDEVRQLKARPGLTAGHSSMRAVGYRQIWSHLDGKDSLDSAIDKTQAATRQLAKRQLTWLRSDPGAMQVEPLESACLDAISAHVRAWLER